mgnify:CR=1 FL=1
MRAWEELTHPEDLPGVSVAMRQHLQGHTAEFQAEFRARTKPGPWRWINVRGRVVERNQAGRAVRVTGVALDIAQHLLLGRIDLAYPDQ